MSRTSLFYPHFWNVHVQILYIYIFNIFIYTIIFIIILKFYFASFGINFQVPVSYLLILFSTFYSRHFTKCLMILGFSFIWNILAKKERGKEKQKGEGRSKEKETLPMICRWGGAALSACSLPLPCPTGLSIKSLLTQPPPWLSSDGGNESYPTKCVPQWAPCLMLFVLTANFIACPESHLPTSTPSSSRSHSFWVQKGLEGKNGIALWLLLKAEIHVINGWLHNFESLWFHTRGRQAGRKAIFNMSH